MAEMPDIHETMPKHKYLYIYIYTIGACSAWFEKLIISGC